MVSVGMFLVVSAVKNTRYRLEALGFSYSLSESLAGCIRQEQLQPSVEAGSCGNRHRLEQEQSILLKLLTAGVFSDR